MTTTEQNPARSEYFEQLKSIFITIQQLENIYHRDANAERVRLKNKALSITYDANVALQKRVEELEAALKKIDASAGLALHGGNNGLYHFCELVLLNTKPLLTKQS